MSLVRAVEAHAEQALDLADHKCPHPFLLQGALKPTVLFTEECLEDFDCDFAEPAGEVDCCYEDPTGDSDILRLLFGEEGQAQAEVQEDLKPASDEVRFVPMHLFHFQPVFRSIAAKTGLSTCPKLPCKVSYPKECPALHRGILCYRHRHQQKGSTSAPRMGTEPIESEIESWSSESANSRSEVLWSYSLLVRVGCPQRHFTASEGQTHSF